MDKFFTTHQCNGLWRRLNLPKSKTRRKKTKGKPQSCARTWSALSC
jgi:hypothetical protein